MKKRQETSIAAAKRQMPGWLFILWAGGTALLSYSLVYALRKPFTAAEFEGLQVAGIDYKVAVSIMQLIGYVCAKLLGIKFISELRAENRLRFIIGSAALSEVSLLLFALLPTPWNISALFFNGLSLGCMWGVIFSFLEGRKTTDILASIMGVSMAVSSGVAKSLGLYAIYDLHISEFWMPALIGAVAFPLLCLTGYIMVHFPQPTAEDVRYRSRRVTMDGRSRWNLFVRFMPLLLMLFAANMFLTLQRDIKEDFIVCIVDVSTISSWAFAYVDSLSTVLLLAVFAVMGLCHSHRRVIYMLLAISTLGMGTLAYIAYFYNSLNLSTTMWLFLQSLCLDVAYLSFQTIFFERFIACFKIQGNVGFFIITIDFIGYLGTLGLLVFKESLAGEADWTAFYNHISVMAGVLCCLCFVGSMVYIALEKRNNYGRNTNFATGNNNMNINLTTSIA